MNAVTPYPKHREADVVLRDGTIVHVRPVRREDEAGLLEFLRALPSEDRRLRFFGLGNSLERAAHDESDVDYVRRFGLVVTATPNERIVGHAMYVVTQPGCAEVAFAIAPTHQSQGLATLLLGQLAEAAAAEGVTTFEATVLPENRRMLDVFRGSGFRAHTESDWSTCEVTLPTSLGTEVVARFDAREEATAAAALRRILAPRSVAVIGASRKIGSVGSAVVRNLLGGKFPGPIYPVNSNSEPIQSLATYATVEAVPGPVDLAVIAVPARRVLEVVEQCGRKGVQSLVVLTAGFGELGAEGRERQAELLRTCRAYGMRLVGPNCIGVINTDPRQTLNATFGNTMPAMGRIGMATQSGAVGLAAIEFTAARALGFSSVVSMGNKADISGNDLLGYWHSDQRTDVILLYLESFGNPRKFARLARTIGRTKPIVALKSGRSSVGARATASHTGALLSASDVTVDALFQQAGVIRTDTLDEMLDVADLLAHQPLTAGRRVAIVTNVGGPAIMCADACEAHGLELPPLGDATKRRLGEVLAPEASLANPVDLLAGATADQYARSLRIVADDPNVDAIIAIFLAPLATRPEDVAREVCTLGDSLNKPILAVFMSPQALPELETPGGKHVPGYHTPEPAAIALAHAAQYARWRAQPLEAPVVFDDVEPDVVETLVSDAIQGGEEWLDPDEVRRVLQAYGIPVLEQRLVTSIEDAVLASEQLGGEVAVKAVAPGLIHKSDIGAVQLGLSPSEMGDAARKMQDRVRQAIGAEPSGFLVQCMAPTGVEMLVGVVNDPSFGPVIACGAGGTLVELLKDVAIRLSPLTRTDSHAMLRELKSFPLLEGYRAAASCDVAALEQVLLRVSALVEQHPSIQEMDLNPVVVGTVGTVVVDARVRVGPPMPRRPIGART